MIFCYIYSSTTMLQNVMFAQWYILCYIAISKHWQVVLWVFCFWFGFFVGIFGQVIKAIKFT